MANPFHCLSVATALLVASVPAGLRAAEPPASDPAPAEASSLAKRRFKAGLALYENADYAGAIEAWTGARMLMAGDPDARGAWHVLGLDLAQAHVRAYRLDQDPEHFGPAARLLHEYVAWVDRPAHTMSEEEREDRPRALEMLAFIEGERAALAAAPAPAPAPVVAPARALADPPAAPVDSAKHKRKLRIAHGLIAGGAVSLGLGVASIVTLVVFARNSVKYEREYEDHVSQTSGRPPTQEDALAGDLIQRKGRQANAVVIAAATGTALFTLAGIGMLTGGLVVRKHALRAAPAVGPGYAGAALSMRF